MSFEVDLNNLKSLLGDLENLLDPASVGAVGGSARGVSPEHLSKIWSIDVETAKRTIDITSQHYKHHHPDHLRRQYSTNDRMQRHKRINTHFFMDTFFCFWKGCLALRSQVHATLCL